MMLVFFFIKSKHRIFSMGESLIRPMYGRLNHATAISTFEFSKISNVSAILIKFWHFFQKKNNTKTFFCALWDKIIFGNIMKDLCFFVETPPSIFLLGHAKIFKINLREDDRFFCFLWFNNLIIYQPGQVVMKEIWFFYFAYLLSKAFLRNNINVPSTTKKQYFFLISYNVFLHFAL